MSAARDAEPCGWGLRTARKRPSESKTIAELRCRVELLKLQVAEATAANEREHARTELLKGLFLLTQVLAGLLQRGGACLLAAPLPELRASLQRLRTAALGPAAEPAPPLGVRVPIIEAAAAAATGAAGASRSSSGGGGSSSGSGGDPAAAAAVAFAGLEAKDRAKERGSVGTSDGSRASLTASSSGSGALTRPRVPATRCPGDGLAPPYDVERLLVIIAAEMQAASRLDPLQMAGWVVKKIQEGMLLLAPIPNATVLQRMAEWGYQYLGRVLAINMRSDADSLFHAFSIKLDAMEPAPPPPPAHWDEAVRHLEVDGTQLMLLSEVHAFWAKKSDWLVRLRQGAGARGADGAGDFGAAEAALQCLETAQALHRLFSSVVTTVTAALLSPQQMIRLCACAYPYVPNISSVTAAFQRRYEASEGARRARLELQPSASDAAGAGSSCRAPAGARRGLPDACGGPFGSLGGAVSPGSGGDFSLLAGLAAEALGARGGGDGALRALGGYAGLGAVGGLSSWAAASTAPAAWALGGSRLGAPPAAAQDQQQPAASAGAR